jgi:hypothetical protein
MNSKATTTMMFNKALSQAITQSVEDVLSVYIDQLFSILSYRYNIQKHEIVDLWNSIHVDSQPQLSSSSLKDTTKLPQSASIDVSKLLHSSNGINKNNPILSSTGTEHPENKRKSKTKPTSGYIHFCNEHRSKLQVENPTMKFGDLSKELGKMWRCLEKEHKQKYLDMSSNDSHSSSSEESSSVSSKAPTEIGSTTTLPTEEELQKHTLTSLRQICAKYHLKKTGNKDSIISRILECVHKNNETNASSNNPIIKTTTTSNTTTSLYPLKQTEDPAMIFHENGSSDSQSSRLSSNSDDSDISSTFALDEDDQELTFSYQD